MKMNDFLNQIMESTNKAQFNIDKKKSNVILFLRGRHYGVRSIVIDPFTDKWNVVVYPVYFELGNFASKTVDDILYLNARKSLMSGMDKDINFVLIDDGNTNNYIPVGTLDPKMQVIQYAKLQGAGTEKQNIVYYFK